MQRGKLLSWPAPPLQWIGHSEAVSSLSRSPNGRIVSGSGDKTIRIWDVETGAPIGNPLTGHTGIVESVAYSPNGQNIVSGSSDTTIRIWDAETGAPVGRPLEGHTDSVLTVAFSPNGQHIISGSVDRAIRIWDAETGVAIGTPLEGHTKYVWSVACSPNGQHIASGSSDNTIREGHLVPSHICPLCRGSLRRSKTGACKGLKAFRRLWAWGLQAAGGL